MKILSQKGIFRNDKAVASQTRSRRVMNGRIAGCFYSRCSSEKRPEHKIEQTAWQALVPSRRSCPASTPVSISWSPKETVGPPCIDRCTCRCPGRHLLSARTGQIVVALTSSQRGVRAAAPAQITRTHSLTRFASTQVNCSSRKTRTYVGS